MGGGDPLSSVTPADECSRARDRPGRKDYTPLSSLHQTPADNPFVTRDKGSVAVDLVNKKNQRFRIYLSATTPAMLKRFIATSSACYEYFPLPKAVGPVVETVQFDALLVQAAVANTAMSTTALAALRDELVASGSPSSLNDVVTRAGGDSAAVDTAAVQSASAALADEVSAGQLTAAEVEALDLPSIVSALAALPQAPFLYPPSDVAIGASQLSAQLLTDKRGVVVIGAVPVNPPPQPIVIWFAFDPTFGINTGQTHDFVAQCRQSDWVEIYSYSGSQRLSFWRQNPYYFFVGQKLANASNPDPGMLMHSSWPDWRGYDTRVYGKAAGQYSIYGGYPYWIKGKGGGC
jgi:hypothetical protein